MGLICNHIQYDISRYVLTPMTELGCSCLFPKTTRSPKRSEKREGEIFERLPSMPRNGSRRFGESRSTTIIEMPHEKSYLRAGVYYFLLGISQRKVYQHTCNYFALVLVIIAAVNFAKVLPAELFLFFLQHQTRKHERAAG